MKKNWTEEEKQELRNLYPNTENNVLTERFKCSQGAIYEQASLGLNNLSQKIYFSMLKKIKILNSFY